MKMPKCPECGSEVQAVQSIHIDWMFDEQRWEDAGEAAQNGWQKMTYRCSECEWSTDSDSDSYKAGGIAWIGECEHEYESYNGYWRCPLCDDRLHDAEYRHWCDSEIRKLRVELKEAKNV